MKSTVYFRSQCILQSGEYFFTRCYTIKWNSVEGLRNPRIGILQTHLEKKFRMPLLLMYVSQPK
jgi:hypothetical protein